jgi:hypothetical protein
VTKSKSLVAKYKIKIYIGDKTGSVANTEKACHHLFSDYS